VDPFLLAFSTKLLERLSKGRAIKFERLGDRMTPPASIHGYVVRPQLVGEVFEKMFLTALVC
jgi:hypothetical protein